MELRLRYKKRKEVYRRIKEVCMSDLEEGGYYYDTANPLYREVIQYKGFVNNDYCFLPTGRTIYAQIPYKYQGMPEGIIVFSKDISGNDVVYKCYTPEELGLKKGTKYESKGNEYIYVGDGYTAGFHVLYFLPVSETIYEQLDEMEALQARVPYGSVFFLEEDFLNDK